MPLNHIHDFLVVGPDNMNFAYEPAEVPITKRGNMLILVVLIDL